MIYVPGIRPGTPSDKQYQMCMARALEALGRALQCEDPERRKNRFIESTAWAGYARQTAEGNDER